jgi:Spy/CpxP family protein refolding chaperone
MKGTLTSALALAALLAVPAFGGHPPGGPPPETFERGPGEFGERFAERHSERLTRALDLTEAQQATLDTLQQTLGDTIRPIFESMRATRDELETLLDAATPDPAAVGAKAIELHAAKKTMRAAHDAFEADIVAMLSETQRAQYEALREAGPRHGRFEHLRHGGEPRRPRD